MDRLDRILALVRQHRPNLQLIDRAAHPTMGPLDKLARGVSPGSARMTIVFGDRVLLPQPLETVPRGVLAAILAHELVHQLDQGRWGPLFYLSYVLPPAGRTMRAWWELRAYTVDMMIAWQHGGEPELQRLLRWLTDVFAGPSYLWMWAGPNAALALLEPVADRVRVGAVQQSEPYRSILAAWTGEEGVS